MKTLTKALLGASMLIPVAAQAQDDSRDARRTEWRANRPARAEQRQQNQQQARPQPQQQQAQQPQPPRQPDQNRGGDRAGWRNAPPPQAGAEAQARFQAARQQRQARGQNFDRNDDGQRRPDFNRQAGGRPDFNRQAGGRPDFNRQAGNRPDFNRPTIDRPDVDRQAGRFDGRPGAQNFGRGDRDRTEFGRVGNDRRDDRRDDRSDFARTQQRRDWNGDNDRRRAIAGNYGGYNRGDQHQVWNRTWRNDDRYDWGRYRSGNSGLYRLPRYYAPYGYGNGYRRFSIGVTLSSVLWDQSYWIEDPYSYRLPEAYGPYRWVRYYDDALLVDLRTGRVIDTVYDIFY